MNDTYTLAEKKKIVRTIRTENKAGTPLSVAARKEGITYAVFNRWENEFKTPVKRMTKPKTKTATRSARAA